MTLLDLFSGIGGFSLAARWVGIETVGFCEIDPYAQKVLIKNFGAVMADAKGERCEQAGPKQFAASNRPRLHRDIFTLNGADYRGVNIVTGGFPCQPFSLAGKRRGKEDDRFLWPEMLRVISEAQPDWVIGENVAGIINMELDRVLSDLESLGYAVQPFVIPACAVDARHRRDRVWIVGHAERSGRRANEPRRQPEGGIVAGGTSEAISLTGGEGQQGREQHGASCQGTGTSRPVGEFCKDVLDPNSARQRDSGALHQGQGQFGEGQRDHTTAASASRWEPEPDVGRVASRVPSRVDRLKCLGNAIVPQVAYQILSAIKKIHSALDIG